MAAALERHETGQSELERVHGVSFIRLRELNEPVCLEMLSYWKAKRGDRHMPSPDDLKPAEFARIMPYLLLLQVDHDPFDLTYRLFGEQVAISFGVNSGGRRVLDAYPDNPTLSRELFRFYSYIASERRPFAAAGTMLGAGDRIMRTEGVYMPLSYDGERTDRILGCSMKYDDTRPGFLDDDPLSP
ncbi:hypothetical protein FHS78_002311 [Parvibaculum indicum]|uniref:PAS domain-containing protein n=1 Tax=Parvibaculum indicum TaxID=562969 RepID=UPI00141F485D|nr:PAS domain-containing protein [Parvibaculum indicum]NIJ42020.1 hypothetical protein [Parvibaculum indicum]